MTQKVRPALIVSVPYTEADRALVGVIPHATAVRGSQWEAVVPTTYLAEGAFLVQGIQAIPPRYLLRRLGVLSPAQLEQVVRLLLRWQGVP